MSTAMPTFTNSLYTISPLPKSSELLKTGCSFNTPATAFAKMAVMVTFGPFLPARRRNFCGRPPAR